MIFASERKFKLQMSYKLKNLIKIIIISVLSLILYSRTIFGDIVFDDTEAILNNKDVMTNTPLSEVFTNDFWGTKIVDNRSHKSYRPLTIIAFRLIRQFSDFIEPKTQINDLKPYFYHSFNIMSYISTNILLFKVLTKLLDTFCSKSLNLSQTNQRTAFLTTILFTCHPIHSEVVCACVGSADLLSSLFALTALLIYLEFTANNKKHNFVTFFVNSILVILMSGIAMLFKEQGITFIGLCVLFDLIIVLERPNINCRTINAKLVIYRAFILCSGAFILLILRMKVMNFSGPNFQSGDNPTSFEKSFFIRAINYNYIYAINAWILIYPQWLCFDWSMNCLSLIRRTTDFRLLFVIIFWIILLALIRASLFHRNPKIRWQLKISLAFGIIPFIPSSNLFFTVGFVIAERALFLPSIGYILLLMTAFNSLEQRFRSFSKILHLFLSILTIIFILRTFERTFDWMNEKQLFNSGLSVCPSNAKIHYNLAKNAADSGLRQKAIDEYQEAIRLNPEYDHALNNLANILKNSGDLSQAQQLLRKAVKVRPSFAAAWMNLGIVEMALNQHLEAENSYLTALRHRHRYAQCYYNLGNLYVKQKRFDDAFKVWRNATLIEPTLLLAWNNLIIMLDNIGSYERAELIAVEALKYHSNQSSLHFNYANVLGKMKKFNPSELHFKTAIDLEPTNANYYSNLAVLYHQFNDYSTALHYYEKALKIDSNLISAQKNLKLLLKKSNQ